MAYIHERLRKYIARAEAYSEAAGTSLQYVLLDMSPVTHLDSTGGLRLCTAESLYQSFGLDIYDLIGLGMAHTVVVSLQHANSRNHGYEVVVALEDKRNPAQQA